uniref:Transmembrane protein n=1 Tax=Nelumbo nucifera TaxID=4432 RepID=A0A822Y9B9_NELNU|nr:TPA_asm: hypothetical protein HUJ06_030475 [Nelumbo nucifera]
MKISIIFGVKLYNGQIASALSLSFPGNHFTREWYKTLHHFFLSQGATAPSPFPHLHLRLLLLSGWCGTSRKSDDEKHDEKSDGKKTEDSGTVGQPKPETKSRLSVEGRSLLLSAVKLFFFILLLFLNFKATISVFIFNSSKKSNFCKFGLTSVPSDRSASFQGDLSRISDESSSSTWFFCASFRPFLKHEKKGVGENI